MYIGRVWLRYTEEEIWRLTPRQFSSQVSVHEDITRQMYGGSSASDKPPEPNGYIDQIKGW